jgi:hypothetical protein
MTPPEPRPDIDERIERLICRRLDQEITPAEVAELDDALRRDPRARDLFEEYRAIDFIAADALRRDSARPTGPAGRPGFQGWRRAAAGGLLAAAAVVAFSFLPDLWNSSTVDPAGPAAVSAIVSPRPRTIERAPRRPNLLSPPAYQEVVGYPPLQRLRNLHRDLIGIRGPNDNVIYILERDARSTRITPVSGDF